MSEISVVALWIMFIFAGIAGAYSLFSAAKLNSYNANPQHGNPRKARTQRVLGWLCLVVTVIAIVTLYYKL